jgi:hypothetical protein
MSLRRRRFIWVAGVVVALAALAGGFLAGRAIFDDGPESGAGAEATLDVDERFDPAKLPPVDTTGWVASTGPSGELTVRVPPGWWADASAQTDHTGTTVIGDFVKVLKLRPGIVPGRPVGYAPQPGDVWADITTERTLRSYSTEVRIFHQVTYKRSLGGRDIEITATQFDRLETFEPGVGALTLFISVPTPSGGYLNAAIHVALPADLTTIAQAQAVLTEIVLK